MHFSNLYRNFGFILSSLLALSSLTVGCEGCADVPCAGDVDCGPEASCVNGRCLAAAPLPEDPVLPQAPDTTDGGAPSEGSEGSEGGAPPIDTDAGAAVTPAADAGAPEEGCMPRTERCSFEDDDCDGLRNEELDCTFVASSANALYRVDPFAQTVTPVLDYDLTGLGEILDVDLGPDGAIYATSGRSLYRLDEAGPTLVFGNPGAPSQGLRLHPNGLAIGDDGSVFVSNQDRWIGSRVERAGGIGEDMELLSLTEPFHSAGDCVFDKLNLLMSAVEFDDQDNPGTTEWLVRVPFDGGDIVRVGPLQRTGVHGLSSSFDYLFGVTDEGEVLLIDRDTGEPTSLFTTDLSFTGAANAR